VADQLATAQDLADALQVTLASLPTASVTLALECATAVVQAAAGGQRIVQVVGDIADLTGQGGRWLDLPQIPVTAVTLVTLDGTTLTAGVAGAANTTYRLRGSRLWRGAGWQTYYDEPSQVLVTNTHGYATGSQKLQFGRNATLGLIKGTWGAPGGGVLSEKIDDYAVQYEKMAALMEESPHLKQALRKEYGRPGGFTRIE
jgi:hypothetical protein